MRVILLTEDENEFIDDDMEVILISRKYYKREKGKKGNFFPNFVKIFIKIYFSVYFFKTSEKVFPFSLFTTIHLPPPIPIFLEIHVLHFFVEFESIFLQPTVIL